MKHTKQDDLLAIDGDIPAHSFHIQTWLHGSDKAEKSALEVMRKYLLRGMSRRQVMAAALNALDRRPPDFGQGRVNGSGANETLMREMLSEFAHYIIESLRAAGVQVDSQTPINTEPANSYESNLAQGFLARRNKKG